GLPGPLLPRPFRIRTMDRALHRAFDDPDPETLAPLFASIPGGVQEARVAIAAAYDTTAHTLAFALWELAGHPEFNTAQATESMVQEAMRLYPAGWIGSRVAVTDTEFDGRTIPAGRMVLYSPYLTHRNPQLWDDPLTFRPDRFTGGLPAWGYLPFAAGERTCLGAALATLMLRTVISAFAGAGLQRISTAVRPRGVITLTPDGPIVLRRTATATATATATSASTSTSTMTGTATYTAPVHVRHRPGAPMVACQPLWG
ncbi:MAG: cytochrome P450, partial [Actinomycetota bacterium]|nr:cytochrome P450 [Actinomycetota bacterium]